MYELEVRNILVSECYTNCYICKNSETKEGFIIDPGDGELKISQNIGKMEMKPVAILLTHGHYDHIGAVEALRKRYDIPVYVSQAEKELTKNSGMNLSAAFGHPMTIKADKYLEDGEKITVAGVDMEFILTPGHTPGSGCFYISKKNMLFSGDTLFCASRGRTDFPGGRKRDIIKSIKEKLLVLPEDTYVLPGHNESTTIGDERVYY